MVDRLNCTARNDDGYEFFVVTDTNEDKYYHNSLFSGIIGLAQGKADNEKSLLGYLKKTKQIDKLIMSVYLGAKEGLVALGQWSNKYIYKSQNSTHPNEPNWTPMFYLDPASNPRGGWYFSTHSIKIGSNNPVLFNSEKESLRVTLVPERDIGYNLVTNKADIEELFIKELFTKYGDSLAIQCK